MSDFFKGLLGIVLMAAVLVGLAFGTGAMTNLYNATIGKRAVDVQREVFQESKPYVFGKIDDLAKYKRQYEMATDPAEKAQVRNWILDEFANFDPSQIQNPDLYNFLMEMERGK